VPDVVGEQPQRHVPLRPLDERQIWLIEKVSPKMHDEIARCLDVDRTSGHHHERFPERNQRRRNVGVPLDTGTRVHPGDEESMNLEETNDLVAHEGEIQVARPWTVRVKRRAILPSTPGDRTAPQYDARPSGISCSNRSHERLEASSLPPNARDTTFALFCDSVRPPCTQSSDLTLHTI
jgi:hypothetical protein